MNSEIIASSSNNSSRTVSQPFLNHILFCKKKKKVLVTFSQLILLHEILIPQMQFISVYCGPQIILQQQTFLMHPVASFHLLGAYIIHKECMVQKIPVFVRKDINLDLLRSSRCQDRLLMRVFNQEKYLYERVWREPDKVIFQAQTTRLGPTGCGS